MLYRDNNKKKLLIVSKGINSAGYFNNNAINETFNILSFREGKESYEFKEIFSHVRLVYIFMNPGDIEDEKGFPVVSFIIAHKDIYKYKLIVHELHHKNKLLLDIADKISCWCPSKWNYEVKLNRSSKYFNKISNDNLNKLFWIHQGIRVTEEQKLQIDSYKPDYSDKYIIAIGNENRNYDSLIESVKDLPINLYIFTTKRINSKYKNVFIKSTVDPGRSFKLMKYILNSLFVIIPLRLKSEVSHGITSAIETRYLKKIIISNKYCGLDYYIKDGYNGFLLENKENYRNCILKLLDDTYRKEIQQNIDNENNGPNYMTWRGYCDIINSLNY